jgi:colanic acid biosynthesis glycosyl transferase WcaI
MRILIMGQHYAPEEVSGAVLATELATDLVRRGHTVTFLTCAPNYPVGKVFAGYQNGLYSISVQEGVKAVRIWSYISSKKTFWRRLFNYGTFSLASFFGGLIAGKPDVLMSASPPLPLGVSAWLLSRIWRVPWVLRVEDLYPDAAVAAGVLKNRSVIAFFSAMERFLYSKASHLSLISDGFLQNLLGKGVSPTKMSVIPVWADPDLIQPLPKDNDFRHTHDLQGKFVVMYAGNLGYNSDLDDVILAANLLQEVKDLTFLIIGEGVKKDALIELVNQKSIKNVQFLPYQPREKFAEMMAAADVNLVTLAPETSATSFPSKTLNIMASERPILMIAPLGCEIAQIVQSLKCGVVIPPGDFEELSKVILAMKSNPESLAEMGRNGRVQLQEKYSRNHCVDLYEKTFLLFETVKDN